MLRTKSALRLNKGQHGRASWLSCLQSHKVFLFWTLALIWIAYLGFSALSRPQLGAVKHSRSLLEASAITGRLEAMNFAQHPVEYLRAAVQKAISPDFAFWRNRDIQDEGVGEYDLLLKSVESIVTQLLATEEKVSCSWDASLEQDLRLLKGQKFLLAANFKDNEDLLPHVIVQLWHLLSILPQDAAFVSVYESGSYDSTGAWLEVMRQLVSSMQVPHRIIIGGNLTRGEEQERIEFLAQVRNAALNPLWLPDPASPADSWFGAKPAKSLWPATRVVFMNDVYFCAKDVVRLLLHEADMACGMDFDRKKLDQIPIEAQRLHLGQFLNHKMGLPRFIGELLGLIRPLLALQAKSDSANEYFRRDLPMGFYDLWVGRDSNGAMFTKDPPYATDPYTLERLPWGLPFPVKCCWNGLVALNASPFVEHAVRIRSHKEGECRASECSLLCNDFLRLGYRKLVVDPGVRQAYNVRDARDLYGEQWVRGINVTSWAEVTSAPPVDEEMIPFRPYSQCCGLRPGNNMVEFDKDCSWENFMHPNFTASPPPPRSSAVRNHTTPVALENAKKERLSNRRLGHNSRAAHS